MKRNLNIDILKFLCAVFVVFLHCVTPINFYYLPVVRCAVPTFFIISGFLMFSNDNLEKRLIKAIKHIAIILLWSTCLFAGVKLVLALKSGDFSFLSSHALFNFVVFNENPFGFHLWYLSAYLYVLVIVLFLKQIKGIKLLVYIFPILLILDLLFGKYSLVFWGREFPYVYVRNFLCVGIPYFTIGMLLKKYYVQLMKVKNIQKISFFGVLLFISTSYLELGLLESLSMNATRDHYLSTTFLSLCLSIFFFTSKQFKFEKIAKLGETDFLYIYIYHPLFIIAFGILFGHIDIPLIADFYSYLNPVIILIATIYFLKLLRKMHLIN